MLSQNLVAERAIRAFLAESNPSQRKRLASGLSIHARDGRFRDRRSHIKSCLDELLDAQSGQPSSIEFTHPCPWLTRPIGLKPQAPDVRKGVLSHDFRYPRVIRYLHLSSFSAKGFGRPGRNSRAEYTYIIYKGFHFSFQKENSIQGVFQSYGKEESSTLAIPLY